MKSLAYYSGTIEVRKDGCYVGGQKIDCPSGGQSLFDRPFMQSGIYEPGSSNLNILPPNFSLRMLTWTSIVLSLFPCFSMIIEYLNVSYFDSLNI